MVALGYVLYMVYLLLNVMRVLNIDKVDNFHIDEKSYIFQLVLTHDNMTTMSNINNIKPCVLFIRTDITDPYLILISSIIIHVPLNVYKCGIAYHRCICIFHYSGISQCNCSGYGSWITSGTVNIIYYNSQVLGSIP